ncbi:unnamed protein product [Lepidochelys olivacea]
MGNVSGRGCETDTRKRDEKAMSPHPVPESPELEKRIWDFPRENNLQEAVTGFLGKGRCWGFLSLYSSRAGGGIWPSSLGYYQFLCAPITRGSELHSEHCDCPAQRGPDPGRALGVPASLAAQSRAQRGRFQESR